jgi:PAS domain S-box-containing protein
MVEKEGKNGSSSLHDLGVELLLTGSRRMLNEGVPIDLSALAQLAGVSPALSEIAENLSSAIQSQQNKAQFEIMKYKLANQAFHVGLWEMDVIGGDPKHPDNVLIRSKEFQKLRGFEGESGIQSDLESWSDSLHPDDKERVHDAFVRHLADITGKTPYNVEYRMKMKNGEYRYFQALGETMRADDGKPLRVAGMLRDIHDEKLHDEELEQALFSNERQLTKLGLVVQAANVGLWDMEIVRDDMVNPANPFNWSSEIREMLGYKGESDFPNQLGSLVALLHPDDSVRVVDHFIKHLLDTTGKTAYNMEYRLLKKSGEYGHFHAFGETTRDGDGNAIRIAGALQDITEAKRTAIADQLQLAKLNLVIQGSNAGLWDMNVVGGDPVNPNNEFIWSQELREMLGFTDENDFPNKLNSWSDRLHPDDKQRTLDAFEKHLMDRTGKTHYDIEYQLQKKNGDYGYYRAYGETIRDKDGNALRVVGALKDISEEKKIVFEMAKQKKDATEQAHWFHSILNAAPLPITVTDANMCWTFVNKAVEDFLGTKLQDMLGHPCSDWNAHICNTPECGIACAKRGLKRTFFSHAGSSYQVDVEILKKMDGEIAGFIEVVQDITKLKEMEEKALAASKAKSQFLANMSHEIRTPMNAILGVAEIQLMDEKLAPNMRDALQKIYSSGDLLLSIINDILDLSKIEAGKLELAPVKYDVASLVNDTMTINLMRIGSKRIEFELCMNENVPSELIGDELRIKQVLNNILSNAFKYTAKGNVSLRVTSEPMEDEGPLGTMLIFEVEDTGQGMTEEQVSRLFDEYSRFNSEANRTTEGTGLGMSITKNLVSMMDGKISVKSQPNTGTTFTIRLPQKSTGSASIGKELAESLQQFRTSASKQIRRSQIVFEPMPYGKVLIVDDVESNLYVARGLMAPYELKIETAMNGLEAIEKIKEGNKYDILFMDHMMPEMDGIEATKRIRDLGYARPIVALTANAVVGQSEVFLANGFDDFISKPIDLRLLNAMLKKHIRDLAPPEVREEAIRAQAARQAPEAEPHALDPKLAEIFVRDAHRATSVLEARPLNPASFSEDDMRLYIINVHAMKSALANIGETELSELAAKLEHAGRENNAKAIEAGTQAFLEGLHEIIEKLTPKEDAAADAETTGDPAQLTEKLIAIKEACAAFNKKIAKTELGELRQQSWPLGTKDQLSAMAEHLLDGDFDRVASIAAEIIKGMG